MKISVDDQEIFTLTDTEKQVIQDDVPSEIFDEDMKRRLQFILSHKYERCLKRIREEWEPKLKSKGVAMLPTDDNAFATLVFSQPDYKNRSQRDSEQDLVNQPVNL